MKVFKQYLYKKDNVKKNQFPNNKIQKVNKRKILGDKLKKFNSRNFSQINNDLKIKIKNKINETTKQINKKKIIKRNSFKSTSRKYINKLYNAKVKIKNNNREILDYYELNNMEYSQAKEFDNRNFSQIYWSLLKREHIFIFTFITKDDYNIKIIKLFK